MYIEEIGLSIDNDDLYNPKDDWKVKDVFKLLILSSSSTSIRSHTIIETSSSFVLIIAYNFTISAHSVDIDAERDSHKSKIFFEFLPILVEIVNITINFRENALIWTTGIDSSHFLFLKLLDLI